MLYGYLGKDNEAIADYTKAIEINPNHWLAHGNRVMSYDALGSKDKAIADLEQSLKINPESFFTVTLEAVRRRNER